MATVWGFFRDPSCLGVFLSTSKHHHKDGFSSDLWVLSKQDIVRRELHVPPWVRRDVGESNKDPHLLETAKGWDLQAVFYQKSC